MKIIVSQQNKKIEIIFSVHTPIPGILPSPSANSSIPGIRCKYTISKAEDFLLAIDRFIKKRKIKVESLKKTGLRFENTGILTERIIRSIILGLKFSYLKKIE